MQPQFRVRTQRAQGEKPEDGLKGNSERQRLYGDAS